MHMKTSMKTVEDRFMKAPYGFVEDDVHWLVARLFKRGDLAFTVNGVTVNQNNKSDEELISFISYRASLMGITADGIQNALPQSTGTTEFCDIVNGTVKPDVLENQASKGQAKLIR